MNLKCVHIENYHQNLEDKEKRVFTSHRLETLESVLSELWLKMVTDYKRPWNYINTDENKTA